MDYFKPQTFKLNGIRFTAHGGQYRGDGRLRWDPTVGFTVEAQIERYGSLPPRTASDAPEVVPAAAICMWPDILRCKGAVAVRPIWLSPFQRILRERFRVEFQLRSITFFYRGEPGWTSEYYGGELLLNITDHYIWPDEVHESAYVSGHDLGTRKSATGLLIQEGGAEVVGRVADREQFQVSWALPKSQYSGARVRRFNTALQYSLALCTNQTVALLRSKFTVGPHWRETIRRQEIPRSLAPINILGRQLQDRQLIWSLSTFLMGDTPEAAASRVLFDRAAEAAEVHPQHAKELLTSLILEGMLRTLDGRPFVRGDDWDRQESFKRFRLKHFGGNDRWRRRFSRADEVLMRLRHPHAHPDWLSDRNSVNEVVQATNDLTYLSWFYGRLILRLSGQSPDSTPPAPLSMQKGWVTAVNMENPE